MIYLYLFGTCFHFIYVFMIIGNKLSYCLFCFIGEWLFFKLPRYIKETYFSLKSCILAP